MIVMGVGHVRMAVTQPRVHVPVAMRLAGRVGRGVPMAMMLVMNVAVRVLECAVFVGVLVAFGEMEPHAHAHQQAGNDEPQGQLLAEQDDGQTRAQERRYGEVGSRSCSPQGDAAPR